MKIRQNNVKELMILKCLLYTCKKLIIMCFHKEKTGWHLYWYINYQYKVSNFILKWQTPHLKVLFIRSISPSTINTSTKGEKFRSQSRSTSISSHYMHALRSCVDERVKPWTGRSVPPSFPSARAHAPAQMRSDVARRRLQSAFLLAAKKKSCDSRSRA